MRPSKFTIYVDDMRTKYSFDTQYEILVRLILSLFAVNPDTHGVTYKDLVSAATNYGTMGKEWMEERLITPKLCKEMLNDHQVSSYQCLYVCLILSFYFSSRTHWQEPGIRSKTRLTSTVLAPLKLS